MLFICLLASAKISEAGTMVDHNTAKRVYRLSWLIKQAKHYRNRGRERGNAALMQRAVNLEYAAESQFRRGVSSEVTAYGSAS